MSWKIECFTCNPVAQNSYLLYQEGGAALLIDAGFYWDNEEEEFNRFIDEHGLQLECVLYTHAHFDHIFGNRFIADNFGIRGRLHHSEQLLFERAAIQTAHYGLSYMEGPAPDYDLEEGVMEWRGLKLQLLHCPGHSPGSMVILVDELNILFGGDVLFYRSIGRTDLPGGNHEQLIQSIKEKLYVLNPDIVVYPGHGEKTSIGQEIKFNPFTS